MNKRLERGLRILILLQSGARYDALRLAQEMKVTRRTIFRDIAMLKELGLTIEYDVDQSTYCVQVPSEPGMSRASRSLNTEELGRVLQASLAGEDPAAVSSAMVIQQIALDLASNQGKLARNVSVDSDDQAKESDSVSLLSFAAQPLPSGQGFQTHFFEKREQLVCFLVCAIDSKKSLAIWDRVAKKEHALVVSEIRYAANEWTMVATTKTGVVLTLALDQLDFICKHELAE